MRKKIAAGIGIIILIIILSTNFTKAYVKPDPTLYCFWNDEYQTCWIRGDGSVCYGADPMNLCRY